MASTWAHLPSGQSGEVYVCPALLNRLAVSPADTFRIVERVSCLTWFAVGREVEFGDKV